MVKSKKEGIKISRVMEIIINTVWVMLTFPIGALCELIGWCDKVIVKGDR